MYNITNANDVKCLEHYLLQQDMWYIITCCMNCLVVPCASNKTFFEEKMFDSIQENPDLQYYSTFKSANILFELELLYFKLRCIS